jgi:hypothetical protein
MGREMRLNEMLRTSCRCWISCAQSSAPLSTPGRRSLSPSAPSERSPTRCFETSFWYPGEGKLDIRFEHAGNEQVIVATAGGFEAAYVRLRVANGEGKDTADDVVVMVTEVRRLEDSEGAIDQTKPIGLPLTWSGSTPPLTVASVHPGSERHIDLLHVDWPARDEIDIARKWSETAPVQLDLTPKPAGGQEILDSGTYEISVEVRARNADAIRYAIQVSWDGKWSGKAAMWDHLRLEPPRKVR